MIDWFHPAGLQPQQVMNSESFPHPVSNIQVELRQNFFTAILVLCFPKCSNTFVSIALR